MPGDEEPEHWCRESQGPRAIAMKPSHMFQRWSIWLVPTQQSALALHYQNLIRNRLYFPFRVIKRNEGNVLSHKAQGAREKKLRRIKWGGNKSVKCSGENSWQGRHCGGKPTPFLQRQLWVPEGKEGCLQCCSHWVPILDGSSTHPWAGSPISFYHPLQSVWLFFP